MIRRRDDGTIDREHWGLVPTAFDLADAYDERVREIATLRRELDGVRRDAERLRWFELHGVEILVSADERGSWLVRWHQGQAYGNTVGEAIGKAALQRQIINDPDDEPSAGNLPEGSAPPALPNDGADAARTCDATTKGNSDV